jgi:signal transduction histidine kinase/Tfp pilus assembly protein PilF
MDKAKIATLLVNAKAKQYLNQNQAAFEVSEEALALVGQEYFDSEALRRLIMMSNLLKGESVSNILVMTFRQVIRSLKVEVENDDSETIALIESLIDIGTSYFETKDYQNSEIIYESAFLLTSNLFIEKVKIHLKLSNLHHTNRLFDKVIEHLKLAEAIILKTEIPKYLELECFQNICDYYLRQGNYKEIAEYGGISVLLARELGNGEYEAKALNTCAIPHAVRGEYKEAFEYMKAALEKAELLDLRKIVASTLVNIGNIFAALYNYEESIRNYKRVLDNYKLELEEISIGITYFNLGCSYEELGDFDAAEKYLKSALEIGRSGEYKLLISRVYFELVKIYIGKGDLETASVYSFEAEKSYQKNGSKPSYETYLANLAMLSQLRKEYDKAIEYGEEAIFYCIRTKNLKTLKRTYKTLADVYKILGKFEDAYYNLEEFSKTSEAFMLEIRERRTMDLEIRYALKDKENEIERLKQEREIDKLKLTYQSEIELQNEKLKMSNQELRQFTYAISHDLKEPLRMISSFSNLWYRKNKKTNDKVDEEYFHFVRDGALRMTTMLQGLLDYATIGKNARKPKMVDLNKIVADIRTILYVSIDENDVIFNVNSLPNVHTHQVLLFQLMQNLISNAIKFKKTDIAPIVNITSTETEKYFIISIQDNGIGIAAQYLKTIFHIFKRLHTKKEYDGTGIGLSLCEKIAHHLGGRISVESKIEEGSTFSFTLPKSLA